MMITEKFFSNAVSKQQVAPDGCETSNEVRATSFGEKEFSVSSSNTLPSARLPALTRWDVESKSETFRAHMAELLGDTIRKHEENSPVYAYLAGVKDVVEQFAANKRLAKCKNQEEAERVYHETQYKRAKGILRETKNLMRFVLESFQSPEGIHNGVRAAMQMKIQHLLILKFSTKRY